MNELDETITTAIRAQAGGGVDVTDLLAGARRRGMRRRRVRQALTGTGAAAAVVAIAVAVAVVPRGGGTAPSTPNPVGQGQPAAEPSGTPSGTSTGKPSGKPGKSGAAPSPTAGSVALLGFRPPLASGAKALTQGGRPGADQRLHVDVTDPEVDGLRWTSGSGWESLSVSRVTSSANGEYNAYEILIGDSEASLVAANAAEGEALPGTTTEQQVTVGGKPATLALSKDVSTPYATLRWQPAAGTWAQILVIFGGFPNADAATARTGILEIAQWARFDRVYRCPVSFRLGWKPSGADVAACRFNVHGGLSGMTVTSAARIKAGGASFTIAVGPKADTEPVVPNETVSGRKVQYTDGWVAYVDGDRRVDLEPGSPSLSRTDALRVIGEVDLVTGTDPATWHDNPLS